MRENVIAEICGDNADGSRYSSCGMNTFAYESSAAADALYYVVAFDLSHCLSDCLPAHIMYRAELHFGKKAVVWFQVLGRYIILYPVNDSKVFVILHNTYSLSEIHTIR